MRCAYCPEHANAEQPTGERCHCGHPADDAYGGTCGNDWCIAWERSMRGGMAR